MRPRDLVGSAIALVAIFTVLAAVIPNAHVKAQSTVPSAAPQKQETAQPERTYRYYGSTVFEGVITSVYYYPEGDHDHDGPVTHIKFNHDEKLEIWFCGDVRQKIKPGFWKRRITLTDELESSCVTNWQLQ